MAVSGGTVDEKARIKTEGRTSLQHGWYKHENQENRSKRKVEPLNSPDWNEWLHCYQIVTLRRCFRCVSSDESRDIHPGWKRLGIGVFFV